MKVKPTLVRSDIPNRMSFLAALVLAITWCWSSLASAGEISVAPLSQAEQWVLTQLAAGTPADLSKNKGSNQLSSKFIEELLSGGENYSIHHHGIQIANAVITGELVLERADVPYFISITDSTFREKASFDYSDFKHDLILEGSHFMKGASFGSIHVGRDVSLNSTAKRKTAFYAQTSFAGAHVGRLFVANGAIFTNSYIDFPGFSQAEFEVQRKDARALCDTMTSEGYGPGTLKSCGNTTKDNIEWLNNLLQDPDLYDKINAKKHLPPNAAINELKKKKNKYPRRQFKSLKDYQKEVIEQLNRLTIELVHPEETPKRTAVFFTALETGHNVHLDGASFEGPVDFRSGIIGRSFYADNAIFKDIAIFTGLKVLGLKTQFISTDFQGPFYIDKANIAGDLIIAADAKFAGPVSFYGSRIGADMKIEKVKLDILNAGNITVKGPAIFRNVTVTSSVTLQNSKFDTLTLENVRWPPYGINENSPDFLSKDFESQQDVGRLCETLKTEGLAPNSTKAPENTIDRLNEILKLPNLYDKVIDDNPYLNLTPEIMKLKKLTDKTRQLLFTSLGNDEQRAIRQLNKLMIELAFPREAPKRGLSIDGLAYNALSVPSGARSKPGRFRRFLKKIHIYVGEERPELKLLEASRFNTQDYSELESFFRRSGHEGWADEVYIKGRQLELRNHKPWEPGDWLTLIFWDKLAGFGRKPFRIIYVSIFILLLGTGVFSPKYLDEEFKAKWGLPDLEGCFPWNLPALEGCSTGSRTLYSMRRGVLSFSVRTGLSLDIFVPTHHPGLLDHWRRSAIPTWVLIYYYFHKFCGMILVPIAAAAFFTHLKIGG